MRASNIDELLLLALWELKKDQKITTFENLVVKAFQLFPSEFGLRGYENKYPDAARINKAWLRCRTDRGWISGSVAHGFDITEKGMRALKEAKLLNRRNDRNRQRVLSGERRTKGGRILNHIEKHPAFQKYQAREIQTITDYEICDLLFSTLDALPVVRHQNLSIMIELVKDYHRTDIERFLKWLLKMHPTLFGSNSPTKKGGMMSQKSQIRNSTSK